MQFKLNDFLANFGAGACLMGEEYPLGRRGTLCLKSQGSTSIGNPLVDVGYTKLVFSGKVILMKQGLGN